MEFQKLALKQYPHATKQSSPEKAYWTKLRAPHELPQVAAVTAIDSNPVAPFDFAAATSTRVQLYSTSTNDIKKTYSRFHDIVYSANFRSDGKLIVTGSANSQVAVLDVASRTVLRNLHGHKAAVRAAKFSNDNVHIFSASDDKTCRLWDLATGTPVAVMGDHKDYVRVCVPHPSSTNIWASASYDHTVKLWDTRSSGATSYASTMTVNHGAPVEACVMLPGGNLCISAGSNEIKVWDLLSGGKLLHSFSSHQKTITSLALDGQKTRLISGSLDGHVKIYDLASYEVIHGFKYKQGVLSVAMTPSNSHLAVGTVDGLLTVRKRVVAEGAVDTAIPALPLKRGGNFKYFLRGAQSKPSESDHVITSRRHARCAPYENALRAFDYRKALDNALDTRNPTIIASMLEELRLRSGWKKALTYRTEETLEPLLSFCIRYVADPKYSALLLRLCTYLVELYSPLLGTNQSSLVLEGLFFKLQNKLKEEMATQTSILQVMGMVESVMTAQSTTNDVEAA
ncbi:U3 small nucleolar RNA-associated protein [Thraustotheca clavata]|uniref:U3 small nucleolar RNA-associated protein n=1 Tax=Thraustotheca clavata TaxID=74557 RepID=A0A1W0A1W8_9STRA|nr:U3 small nucleolar RNA-associated protein [Thraustotheca clavata]